MSVLQIKKGTKTLQIREMLCPGMRVKIRTYSRTPEFWNDEGLMDKWMGKEVTIRSISGHFFQIEEDPDWAWRLSDVQSIIKSDDPNLIFSQRKQSTKKE